MLVASGRLVEVKRIWKEKNTIGSILFYSGMRCFGRFLSRYHTADLVFWQRYSSAFLRNLYFYLVPLKVHVPIMYRAKTKPGYFRHFKAAYPQTKTDAEILQYASEYNLVDNEYFFDRYESWWTTNNWFPMHITIPKNVTICELMSRHPPQKNDQLWNHEQASPPKMRPIVKL